MKVKRNREKDKIFAKREGKQDVYVEKYLTYLRRYFRWRGIR
jgi:hypothetical protein